MAKTSPRAAESTPAPEAEAPHAAPAPQAHSPESIAHAISVLFGTAPTIAFQGFMADLAALPQVSRSYLVRHGFGKSLQDAIGGVGPTSAKLVLAHLAGEVLTEGEDKGKPTKDAEAGAKLVATHGPRTEGESDEAYATRIGALEVKSRMGARAQRILDGTMGETAERASKGPTLGTLDRFKRDVALELMRAAAKAKGNKLPTGDALQTLIGQVVDGKKAAFIADEAARRLALAEAGDDLI